MNGDLEDLLRTGLAERAEQSPPETDDAGLADLAIAGARRIRRRRVAAAASGAGLLVLGAAMSVWQPWIQDESPADDLAASDSAASALPDELGLEFVVESDSGYQVVDTDGDAVTIGGEEPTDVYRLQDAYLADTEDYSTLLTLDGAEIAAFERADEESYTKVNSAADEFAMVTSTPDMAAADYLIRDAATDGRALAEFTVSYSLNLQDWSDSTVVFTADLWSSTAGEENTWYFDEQGDWNLEAIGMAGYESVIVIDATNADYVCVADLEPSAGLAEVGEYCGDYQSTAVRDELAAASGDEEALQLLDDNADTASSEAFLAGDLSDFGDYEEQYYSATYLITDPLRRWEMSFNREDSEWMLTDATGEEPELTFFTPPSGAIMPVVSYVSAE